MVLSLSKPPRVGVDDKRRSVRAGANSWLAHVPDRGHPKKDDATRPSFIASLRGRCLIGWHPLHRRSCLASLPSRAPAADSKFCRAARSCSCCSDLRVLPTSCRRILCSPSTRITYHCILPGQRALWATPYRALHAQPAVDTPLALRHSCLLAPDKRAAPLPHLLRTGNMAAHARRVPPF